MTTIKRAAKRAAAEKAYIEATALQIEAFQKAMPAKWKAYEEAMAAENKEEMT